MSFALVRLLSLLPLPVLHALGVILGWVLYLSPGRHRDRLKNNLLQSGLIEAHPRLLRQVIAETGKSILELAAMWMRPQDKVARLVREVRGWDEVEAALNAGRGVVFVAPHLGCFEILSLHFACQHPLTAMYKPARHQALDRIMRSGRERGMARLVPTDLSGVKALLRALKRGEAIGVLPDQVATTGDGIWAPFFGRWAYTPTMTVRLIQSTGAPALMAYAERLPWGRGYRMHFEPLSQTLPSDLAQATAALNREVERVVRKFPAQYMWSYNRYKKPGGAEDPPSPPAP
jgi:KDO2-lipid IV(A) lauroyltransferase